MQVFYRADRIARPRTALPVRALRPNDGWCDATGDRNYNRLVTLPYPARAERLWRGDDLYDIVVVLDHNTAPRARGRGSAVFLHIASEDYAPTRACIALKLHDLRVLLEASGPGAAIRILP